MHAHVEAACDLRCVITAVEAFSVEEIASLLVEADKASTDAGAHAGRSLGQQLADSLRPLTSSGRACKGAAVPHTSHPHASIAHRSSNAKPSESRGSSAGGGAGEGVGGGEDARGAAGESELVRRLLKTIEQLQVSCMLASQPASSCRARLCLLCFLSLYLGGAGRQAGALAASLAAASLARSLSPALPCVSA
jgi:hypothetical protein